MSAEHTTTNSLGVQIAVGALRDKGIDPDPILQAVGLDPTLPYGPAMNVEAAKQGEFFERAAAAMNDPFLGFWIADHSNPLELGPISYVSLTSATFGNALFCFQHYLKLLSDLDDLEFIFEEGVVIIAGVPRPEALKAPRQMQDCAAQYFLSFCRHLTGGRVNPIELRLGYSFDGDPTEHIRRFGAPVRFGYERVETIFRESDLALPLATSDPRLHAVLAAHCDALLAEIDHKTPLLLRKVQDALIRLFPLQKAKAEFVAREIKLSERSLHRKLAELGTSFGTLRDSMRRKLAHKYLTETDESIVHIAHILDYSSQSSFNSSFRRLTGKTPGEVRRGAAWR